MGVHFILHNNFADLLLYHLGHKTIYAMPTMRCAGWDEARRGYFLVVREGFVVEACRALTADNNNQNI